LVAELNDPQLDRIMADALAGNPTLDVALDRLRLASAAVEATHAGLLPQIGIDGALSGEMHHSVIRRR
jgi:outer membrane protein TolC